MAAPSFARQLSSQRNTLSRITAPRKTHRVSYPMAFVIGISFIFFQCIRQAFPPPLSGPY